MNPEEMQAQQDDMTADEAAASLSFATNLSQQMMPKMAPEAPESQEMGDMMGDNGQMADSTIEEQKEPEKPALDENSIRSIVQEELKKKEPEEPKEEDNKEEEMMMGHMEDLKKEVKETIKSEIKKALKDALAE